jgi:hypothetical protein
VGGADTLETEGLVFHGMHVSHVRAGCKVELPCVSISAVGTELSKMVAIIGPRSHKAIEAERLWGYTWKNI